MAQLVARCADNAKVSGSSTSFQDRQETIAQRLSEIDKIVSSNAVSPALLKLIRTAAKSAHDELAELRARPAALDADKVNQVQNRRLFQ